MLHMADAITAKLRAAGITQEALSPVLGLSRPAISDRMRGRTRWALTEAREIADLLGITLDSLVGDEDLDCDYVLTEAGAR